MKLIEIQKKLKNQGMRVFTTQEFQRITGLSLIGSRKFLLRYTAQGFFWQLKRGFYALHDDPAHPWIIANKLYRPSYISLETALSHYGLIPESVYAVTSVTTKVTRELEACNTLFLYHTIKQEAFTGYAPVTINGSTALMAEPEKAVADFLYFVHLGKKEWNDRMKKEDFEKKKLWNYLKLFERKNLLSWSQDVIGK